MKDFRNYMPWRNYGTHCRRGDDKQLINWKVETRDYIAKLEGQIVELSIELDKLKKEVDDGR